MPALQDDGRRLGVEVRTSRLPGPDVLDQVHDLLDGEDEDSQREE